MNCPRCGTSNLDTLKNCVRCGAALVAAGDAETFIGASLPPSPAAAKPAAAAAPGVAAATPPPDASSAPTAGPWAAFGIAGSSDQVDFGPRYRIERLLGQGGMGAVYRAWDKELERPVALKLIRPGLALDPGVEQRFKQELLLASKISHRNILRIHDLGEANGVKFISMAFVEGQDLHQLLAEQGKLPLDRALRITTQLCAALDAAHSEGVVHRDFKPQNILLDKQGNVHVSDFGLAKSLEQDLGMTKSGEFLGTPRYMAPEQVQGGQIDHRVDLYALGLILYEMVTGDVPFHADTTLQLMYKRVHEAPKNPKALNPELPDWLVAVILKCLERDPDQRYQSASEILRDISAATAPPVTPKPPETRRIAPAFPAMTRTRWVSLVAAILVVAAALGTVVMRARHRSAATASGKPVTVLVADFANNTGDPVFDGTLEPVFNTALEAAPFINAYRRGTAHRVGQQLRPGSKMDEAVARLVAVREGIDVIISGAISREGAGYGISAQAVDASSGKRLAAANTAVSSREAVLSSIGKLAAPIRTSLGDTTPESAQVQAEETFTTSSLEAAHNYSQAQELAENGKYDQAIQLYLQSVKEDPNMGRAYAGLAVASVNSKKLQEAGEYYKKTLGLLDRMSEREKYRTLGTYYSAFVHNYRQAIESYEKLTFLYPGDSAAFNNLSIAYVFSLDFPKAIAAVKKSIEISPRNLLAQLNYALYSMYAGDFATAINQAQRLIEQNSSYQFAYLPLALSQLGRGDTEGARATYAKLEKINSEAASVANIGEADLEMYFGQYKKALEILQKGIAADEKEKNTGEMALKYVARAEAQLALGNRREAINAADKASSLSKDETVLYPAARVLVQAGEDAKARKIASELDNTLQQQNRSYAQLIAGEIALQHKQLPEAVEDFRQGQKLRDSWISHFLLGRAYLDAGHFPEAVAEFETCKKRQGETADLMFADSATLRYLPPLYYWLAKSQQGMGMTADANANYKQFLALRGDSSDPLVAEARAAAR